MKNFYQPVKVCRRQRGPAWLSAGMVLFLIFCPGAPSLAQAGASLAGGYPLRAGLSLYSRQAPVPAILAPLPGQAIPLPGLPESADTGKVLKKKPLPVTVFGYYRLFLYGRNMTEPYPNLSPYEKAYGVGDGYREPMLSMTVMGRPSGRSSFGTELFVFTPYLGEGYQDNVFSVNLGINFFGNFRTDIGKFGIRAGGIHWYNLSPFTIGVYQILDRFTIFDRTPWEGVDGLDKYDNYFTTGRTNPGDLRWNYQAFQGIILDGAKLPGGLAFDLFWGKTQPNGGLPNAQDDPLSTIFNFGTAGNVPTYQGFAGDSRVLPSYLTGGKLKKNIGKQGSSLAFNTIYSYRSLDSLSKERREYQVHTLSFDFNLAGINLSGELGGSKYSSPEYAGDWGEALMARVKIPAKYTFLPLDIQVYQVGKGFFNENGEIATNNNPDIQPIGNCGVAAGQSSAGGLITQVNQLAHNRRGVNVNTGLQVGPAKLAVGWGLAAEIDPATTVLSFIHRVNGLAMSRIYNPFPANAVCATNFGPYGRQFSFFRGVFERVRTTDLDPATAGALTRKYYNAVDLQAKLKSKLAGRPLFFFYLGSFGSASSRAGVLPAMDEDSYLFVQSHELDLYCEIVDDFILTGYLGLENARGGRFSDWDMETDLPRDQFGTGIGLGFDWAIAQNAGIYFRHRWMNFEDRSFPLDHYKGREVTIELKIFF